MDPEEVHAQKEILLSNLSLFMHKCFPYKKEPPGKLLYFFISIFQIFLNLILLKYEK